MSAQTRVREVRTPPTVRVAFIVLWFLRLTALGGGRVERLTGRHWSWMGTLVLGVGMMLWIALQLIWLDPNALHAVYGTVGVVLVSVGLSATLRSHLQLGDPSS